MLSGGCLLPSGEFSVYCSFAFHYSLKAYLVKGICFLISCVFDLCMNTITWGSLGAFCFTDSSECMHVAIVNSSLLGYMTTPCFFATPPAPMHWVVLHHVIKGSSGINILSQVSWAHGQDFLLGHSISLCGSSSSPVTLFLVVTLRACDAFTGGVNVNRAQGLPWVTPALVEQPIPEFKALPWWSSGCDFQCRGCGFHPWLGS